MRERVKLWLLRGLEAALVAACTAGAGWVVAKVGSKSNAKANADIRASYAQERIAVALEKLAAQQRGPRCSP